MDLDQKLNNEVDSQTFKSFFRRQAILRDEESLSLLCGLYPGMHENSVNYLRFLQDAELVDREVADKFLHKTEKTLEEKKLEQFAGLVELYCRVQNLPIFQIYDVYDTGMKGHLTYDEFKDLSHAIRGKDSDFNDYEVENLFCFVDNNKSHKITKDEFYRVILAKYYDEWLYKSYAFYDPVLEVIRTSLRNQKCRNVKEFFDTQHNTVNFQDFSMAGPRLGLGDGRSDEFFKFMTAFEDEELRTQVNLVKVGLDYEASKSARPPRRTRTYPIASAASEQAGQVRNVTRNRSECRRHETCWSTPSWK